MNQNLDSLGIYNRSIALLNEIAGLPVLLVNPYEMRADLDANLAGVAAALAHRTQSITFLKFDGRLTESRDYSTSKKIQLKIQEKIQEKQIKELFKKYNFQVVKRDVFCNNLKSVKSSFSFSGNLIDYLEQNSIKNYSKGIYSELSEIINPELRLDTKWKNTIITLQKQTKVIEDAMLDTLALMRPETVVIVPNGKWALASTVIDISNLKGFRTLISETGSKMNRVQLFEKSVHSLSEWEENIKFDWNSSTNDREKRDIAIKFVQKNRDSRQNPYVNLMQMGSSVPKESAGKKRIVFFTTSDSESSPFEDSKNPTEFNNQYEAARALFDLQVFKNWEKIVRCHPHLDRSKFVESPQLDKWEEFQLSHLCTILPGISSIDSYELAKSADLVAGFSSTILLESIYLGIPTVICGPTFLGSLLNKNCFPSLESLKSLDISRLKVLSRESERVLPFFYHQAIRGFDNPFLKSDSPINRKKWEVQTSRLIGYLLREQGIRNS